MIDFTCFMHRKILETHIACKHPCLGLRYFIYLLLLYKTNSSSVISHFALIGGILVIF